MLHQQIIINGVLLGGLYACMAIGFSVIWGVMNIINLAHGSMAVIGAYITYWLFTLTGLDPFLSLPISGATLFVIGYLLQRCLLNRVLESSVFMVLILTFGIDLVLKNINVALFSADIRSVTTAYSGLGFELLDARVPYARLAVFLVAVLLTIAVHMFMERTRLGNAIKATSFDRDAARLAGVDIMHIYAITFGIGACMAGIAGSLTAVFLPFTPFVGDGFTMRAFVVVVLGGLGSIPGAIAGGILLGVIENVASVVLSAGLRDAVTFMLLVIILVVQPHGLFGKRFFAELKA